MGEGVGGGELEFPPPLNPLPPGEGIEEFSFLDIYFLMGLN
jgi:hypothetical protein